MRDRDSDGGRRHSNGDTLLAKFAFAWLAPAVVLTVIQLAVGGRLTPVVVALDAIAAIMLPFGLLSLAIAFATQVDDGQGPEEDGGDGGWWSSPHDEEPPPLGGLSFDWDTFETDFQTYATNVSRA